MHYNKIILQTSPDRSHVDTVIDTLEKAQLIMEHKIRKQERKKQHIHSQKRIMGITDLGRDCLIFQMYRTISKGLFCSNKDSK
jgi:hypothetical protein